MGSACDAGAGTVRPIALAAAIHSAEDAVESCAQHGRLLQQEPIHMLAERPQAVVAMDPEGGLPLADGLSTSR